MLYNYNYFNKKINKINIITTLKYNKVFFMYFYNILNYNYNNTYLFYVNIKSKNKKICILDFNNNYTTYYSLGLLLKDSLLKKNIRRSVLNIKLLLPLVINNIKYNKTNIYIYYNSFILKKYIILLNVYLNNIGFKLNGLFISRFTTSNIKIKRDIKKRITKKLINT